jgi:hypothetical protein
MGEEGCGWGGCAGAGYEGCAWVVVGVGWVCGGDGNGDGGCGLGGLDGRGRCEDEAAEER